MSVELALRRTGDERLRLLAVLAACLPAAVLAGYVTAQLAGTGKLMALSLTACLLLPFLFWRVPAAGPVVLVAAATSIERLSDFGPDSLTGRIPLFRSLQESVGLAGFIALPVEVIIAMALLAWLARAPVRERRLLPRSLLAASVLLVVLSAVAAEMIGLARGGQVNLSLWELRPFAYLALGYLLTAGVAGRPAALRALLWALVIGTGLKGILGTERTIAMAGVYPAPESLLEHDESVFFAVYLLLTAALWSFGFRGRLRRVATLLAPFVLVALLGNNRRAAWVIVPALAVLLVVLTAVRRRRARPLVLAAGLLAAAVAAGYVAAFHTADGLAAAPARAVWSNFQPDPRDASSDLYRQLENQDLIIDIHSSPLIGRGFGTPYPQPIPLYDASSIDPLIKFVPHNTVLYIWMRTGAPGMLAFCLLVGLGLAAGTALARNRDATLALLGTVAAGAMAAYLIQGWYDVGLTSFRITIVIGCLLGAVEAARRLEGAARQAGAPLS